MAIQYNRFGQPVNVDMGLEENLSRGIGTIPDFQNYYNMNRGNQAFPHTGMQASEMIETNVDQPNQENFFSKFSPVRGLSTAYNFANKNIAMPAIAGLMGIANRYNPLREGSQNYNPQLQGQIDMLRGEGRLGGYDPSGPYKITSGPLAGQNLVSGFGTNDYDEMLAKKRDWFEKRGEGKRSEKRYNELIQEIQHRAEQAQIAKDQADKAAAQKPAYGGPIAHSYDPKQGGGGRPDRPGGFTDPGKGSYGPWSAQGGYMTEYTRSRYNKGGRVGILAGF